MEPRFLFSDGAQELFIKVKTHCQVCGACNSANYTLAIDQQWTLIPPTPMESVSMDVFSMHEVKLGRDTNHCVGIVVHRHLGYLVAIPAMKKGLTVREVAEKMIKHLMTIFDIAKTICRDDAAQFTGGWFRVRCAYIGVRHATSVAHLSRSNGRAKGPVARFSRRCAGFTLRTQREIGLGRWGEPSNPTTTCPHHPGCLPTKFSSPGTA